MRMELTGSQLATLTSRGHEYADITRAIIMLSVLDLDTCLRQTELNGDNKMQAVYLDIQTFKDE